MGDTTLRIKKLYSDRGEVGTEKGAEDRGTRPPGPLLAPGTGCGQLCGACGRAGTRTSTSSK